MVRANLQLATGVRDLLYSDCKMGQQEWHACGEMHPGGIANSIVCVNRVRKNVKMGIVAESLCGNGSWQCTTGSVCGVHGRPVKVPDV